MTAEVELVGLDPTALLQAAFDLQDQRNAARNQAAQLEAELAELTSLARAARVASDYDCGRPVCKVPSCALRHFLERPVAA